MAETPSMDEPQERQQDPKLYPQVMHRIIDGTGKGWLTAYNYRHRRSDRLPYPDDLPSALIDTGHRRLLRAILGKKQEESSFSSERGKLFWEAVHGYIERGMHPEALELIQSEELGESKGDFPDLVRRLCERSAPDSIISELLGYASSLGDQEQVHKSIYQLWEMKKFSTATGIIATVAAPHRRPLFALIQRLHEEGASAVTRQEALEASQTLMTGPVQGPEEEARDTTWDDSEILSRWTNALMQSDAEIAMLRDALDLQGDENSIGYRRSSFSDRYDAEQKILKSLVQSKCFDEALAYADQVKASSYTREEIARSMMEQGNATNDLKLLKQGLDVITEVRRQKIEPETKEGGERETGKNAWIHRIDRLETEAMMHADLAIYEVKHGSMDTARVHIDAMITATEARGTPGKAECPPDHLRTLQLHRRRLKKQLKGLFMTEGVFHVLPKKDGWNTPVKDPAIRKQEQEEKSARWEEQRNLRSERSHEEQQAASDAMRLNITRDVLRRNGPDGAASNLTSSLNKYDVANRWNRAKLILEAKPELFAAMTPTLTECYLTRDMDRYRPLDWRGLASYYATASRLGAMGDEDWKKLSEGIFSARQTHEGLEEIHPDFVVTLVKEMIDGGEVAHAWKRFEEFRSMGNGVLRGTAAVSSGVQRVCLAHFARAVKPQSPMASGIAASLTGSGIPSETDSSDAIGYWNTETELAYAGIDEGRREETEKRLIELCNSPANVRAWTRLLAMGTLRTPHQVKDGLLGVYGMEGATDEMKRRVVYGLIEQKIPGAESLPDFKRADSDERVTALFIRKLVEKGYLDKHAITLLDNDPRHLPYLRRLLSAFPNEFNTVMETVSKATSGFRNFRDLDYWGESDLKTFSPEDWEGVLTTLRHLGIFTPGIYAEAKKGQFQPAVLNGIGERIRELKKSLFVNRPLESTASIELQAEVIYAAYKPANMSFGTLLRLLQYLRDCSHHLANFVIPEDGYALDLRPSQTMKLKKDAPPPAAARFARYFADGMQPLEGDENVKTLRGAVKTLCDIAKLKSPDTVNLQDLAPLFAGQDFATVCIRDVVNARTENELFKGVMNLQELFGVYLKDNLERIVQEFLQRHEGNVSKMIASTAESLRSPKVRETLERQCQTKLDTDVPDIQLLARALSTVILKKVKSLKSLRRSLKNDAAQFEGEESGETVLPMPKLRAVISKNVASFFGKASAGICTDADTDLFYREDHFNINIVDEEKQICVGNVQAYIMEHEGSTHLLLRGFNPSTALLKEVDAGVFCDAVINVAEQFVADNNLGGILLSEQGGFLALSNRPEAVRHLQTKYAKNAIELEEPFNIARTATIKAAYKVSGTGVKRPTNVLNPGDLEGLVGGNSFAA